jgi:protein O-mannosyl-transferase
MRKRRTTRQSPRARQSASSRATPSWRNLHGRAADGQPEAQGWYRVRLRAIGAVIGLIAVLVYLPALTNGFTNWDDTGYVVENVHLHPFDSRFVAWAFTTFQQGNWHPLTWLSLGIDRAVFGLAPLGYHLTNALLHGVTTFVAVQVVGRLFAQARRAWDREGLAATALVGLLFAAHPLHVESVAWVSERKGLLCGLFYLLAALSYLRFAQYRRPGAYLASLVSFALALMAKPMAVSLPVILLVLDAYPLARMTKPGLARVMLEKVPFIALAMVSSLVTLLAQAKAGAVLAVSYVGIASRLWGAARGVGFYLAKTVFPVDLVPVYPLEHGVSPWRWDFLLSLALVLAATGVAIHLRRRVPVVAALWAAFLTMLLPVIGLVQVGEQAAADRYMYLPLLVPAIGMVALCHRLWQVQPRTRIILAATSIVAIIGLTVLTVRQIGVWRDSLTLWTWVVAKQPRVAIAHYNLGEYLRKKGDWDGAALHWRRAVEVQPEFSWPLNQLGNLAVRRGEIEEARSYYERATNANVRDAVAQYNFAGFLEDQGQLAEARVHYELFLRYAPPTYSSLIPEVRAKVLELAAMP